LYPFISLYFDKMRFKYGAVQEHEGKAGGEERYAYSATHNELEAIISVINLKIEEEYSLFRQDILQEWVYIATFFADPSIIARIRKLRQVILNEYNNNNVTEYEKLTAKIS
jgi:hypothetical protein